MLRFFDTACPWMSEKYYTVDIVSHFTNIRRLIDDERYFVLHVLRQLVRDGLRNQCKIVGTSRVLVLDTFYRDNVGDISCSGS